MPPSSLVGVTTPRSNPSACFLIRHTTAASQKKKIIPSTDFLEVSWDELPSSFRALPISPSVHLPHPLPPSTACWGAMADIRNIAKAMIAADYGRECVRVYKIFHKSIVDEGLYCLGFERLSRSRIQKIDWEVLDLKIGSWLGVATVVVKILLSSERIPGPRRVGCRLQPLQPRLCFASALKVTPDQQIGGFEGHITRSSSPFISPSIANSRLLPSSTTSPTSRSSPGVREKEKEVMPSALQPPSASSLRDPPHLFLLRGAEV